MVQAFPYIIKGIVKLNGILQSTVTVTIKNNTQNQTGTWTTNTVGEYATSLSDPVQFSLGYDVGHNVTVSCSFTSKTITVPVGAGTTVGGQTVDLVSVQKTFVADGQLLKRQSKQFTADAFLEYILAKGLTVDGHLLKRIVKQCTVDAILEAAGFKGLDTDALLLKRISKVFTADAFLTQGYAKGLIVDGLLLKRQTATFAVDAWLTTPVVIGPPLPSAMKVRYRRVEPELELEEIAVSLIAIIRRNERN